VAVSLAKMNNGSIVSSVELTDSFEMTDNKGKKASYSIRLETWKTGVNGNTEVRVVIRDVNTGQWHGATNFKQNILLDMTNLMSGNHSNKRAKAKK
jgi:hypothetical protein